MLVLFTIVLWLHIISAIGWLGSVMLFSMIIGPGLAKLSPESRGDFVLTIVPKYVRYSVTFAVLTLIFGVSSLVVLANGNFSMMAPTTPFGMYISAGVLFALIAFAVGLGVAIPAANQSVKILKTIAVSSGPPPPELKAASDRMRMGSAITMVLLVLVTVMMVAGATL